MGNNTFLKPAILPAFLGSLLLFSTSNEPVQAQQSQDSATTFEEIVVTARRREENLMETPVSITALTADDLRFRQIESSNQIAEAVPNLIFRNQTESGGSNIGAVIFIRGIGQTEYNPSVQPGVGTYVDGAYLGSVVGALTDIVDIESIEVLRGPQGTLFGRNTIGGAILINSIKPNDEFSGYMDLTAGNLANRQVKGSLNIPFTDNLFGRFSAIYREKDGWIKTPNIAGDDNFGSDETRAVRGALRWLPTDNLTVDLTADFSHKESDGPARVASALDPNAGTNGFYNNVVVPLYPGKTPYTVANTILPLDSYTVLSEGYFPAETEIWGLNLTAEWDLGPFTLNSVTTYRNQDTYDGSDGDYAGFVVSETQNFIDHEQWSQELRLSGQGFDNRLNWTVGLYHYQQETSQINPVRFSLFAFTSGIIVENKSSAVFGQASYDLTDQLSLTIGGRYSVERFDDIINDRLHYLSGIFVAPPNPLYPCTGPCAGPTLDGYWPGQIGYLPAPVPPNPGAVRFATPGLYETDVNEFDPYINIAYQWNDRLMTYASYSEGFKGGGFTQRLTPGNPVRSFGPEFAQVYEIGAKWGGDRIRATGALFYTDYTDLQVPVSTLLGSSLENGGDAEIMGFELEVQASVTSRFQLSGGVGYLDGEYSELNPSAGNTVQFAITNELPSVPEWQTNASAMYRLPVAQLSGEIVGRLDYNYVSEHYVGALNEVLTPSYDVFNGSITYLHDSDKWEVALQGRNIFDELYTQNVAGALQAVGVVNYQIAPPAEWSVRFRYRF